MPARDAALWGIFIYLALLFLRRVFGRRPNTYHTYLRSDNWARIRQAVRQRSGGWCERCGKKRAVNVHHLTYRRIYREPLTDLIHLCRRCHVRAHGLPSVMTHCQAFLVILAIVIFLVIAE